MSGRQQQALVALGRQSMTAVAVAQRLDTNVGAAQRILDALYRRSLVTITPMGRYSATERGRKRVAA